MSHRELRGCEKYLGELIDYGGVFCTRAEAIQDMQRMGADPRCIDRWLQGNEHARERRERRERLAVRVYLSPSTPRPSV